MSLLQFLQEAEVLTNIDVNLTINTLHQLQESCPQLQEDFKYTADMVPVRKIIENTETVYVMDLKDVLRLKESCDCSVEDAMKQMVDTIKSEEQNFDITIGNLAVCCEKENTKKLSEACLSDPQKMQSRCKNIAEYVDLIKTFKDTGVKIYMK